MGLATFWAIFSQAHLVTLLAASCDADPEKRGQMFEGNVLVAKQNAQSVSNESAAMLPP
jgi:hypothetical protein